MSIKGCTYGVVSAALLLTTTAYAESGDPAAKRPKPATPAVAAVPATGTGATPADPQAPRALGAAAAAKGKQGHTGSPARDHADGDHGQHGEGDHAATAERGPRGPAGEGHDRQLGRPEGPPRAAIEALMKAQSLSEEQAIAHLRAQGEGASGEHRHEGREEVRRERAKALRGRLKSRGIPNQLRAELRTHARRLAQIERIRTLAAADAKLIERIDAMLVRENDRHTRRLTRLVDEANQAPAEAVPSAAAAPETDKAEGAAEPPKSNQEGVTP